MLDEICSALLHHRPKSLKATPTKIEKAILSLFPKIDNLEEYWCLEFIAKFSEKNPTIILRLAEKMARDKRDVYHLKNVFSKVVPKWKLRKDFFRIINRIKSWLNKSSRLSILAHEILPTFYDPDTLDSLMNYIDKEKPNSIIDTARVVSSFPKNDYFFNAFTELLAMAEPLGEEAFRHVTSILSSSLWLKQGSRTIGKPSQADIDAKNESQKILKANNIPSKVRKVFQEMVKQANDRIHNDMEHDAEFLEK